MLWVVLDSNIYVSALLFGGNPRAAIECAENGLIELAVSDSIKAEVERVLTEKFSWPKHRIDDATSYLWSLAHSFSPQQTVTDCVDPDDNKVLECALEAGATLIVTGDSHLLQMHPYRGIAIMSARQFLESKPWKLS